MLFEQLESRRLMSLVTPVADLLVDANRDGVINASDDVNENIWTNGKSGRGALILPNVDKDNTNTAAPDNWTGGVWNGKPAAPNNVIDTVTDLADIGRLRLKKLGVDDAYNYRVTIQLLKPATGDPAWLKTAGAADRVRIFFPTRQLANGDVVPQAGDVAVIGPGLGDTIRFVAGPVQANEYSVMDLGSPGWMEFGIEGLKAGAQVRVRVTVEYIPIFESNPAGGVDVPTDPATVTSNEVAIRVAPFVLQDNRQAVSRIFIENMNVYGFDNANAREVVKRAFGARYSESKSGDFWQQDGYEIGYARTPTGSMPIVLELPRARQGQADTVLNMRSFVRGQLLAAGVGVSTELANQAVISGSTYGGDIESLPRPGAAPGQAGFLLASGMPQYMKDFFGAQGVNPLLDLKLDDWMSVAHVDEVVQVAPSGNKVLIADPDVAWALALWATKLDPNVRVHPKMNGNEWLPGYTADGMKLSAFLANPYFRQQNLQYAQHGSRLRGVYNTIKNAMKLTDEISAPAKWASATGTVQLLRGGAFTHMIGNVKRTFQVKFLDGDRYQIQYRDEGGAYSRWYDGRKSRDEVFTEAKAFLLKEYWTGTAKAGDRFTFTTNPAATLIKMPVLFWTGGLLVPDQPPEQPWRLGAFTTNQVNSIMDGVSVVAGGSYGPRVNFDGSGVKRDLFDAYATSAFRAAGFTKIFFADTRLYHDVSGSLHCGTNTIRAIPGAKWWEA